MIALQAGSSFAMIFLNLNIHPLREHEIVLPFKYFYCSRTVNKVYLWT